MRGYCVALLAQLEYLPANVPTANDHWSRLLLPHRALQRRRQCSSRRGSSDCTRGSWQQPHDEQETLIRAVAQAGSQEAVGGSVGEVEGIMGEGAVADRMAEVAREEALEEAMEVAATVAGMAEESQYEFQFQ